MKGLTYKNKTPKNYSITTYRKKEQNSKLETVLIKESEIKNTLQDKFIATFQFTEFHSNSTTLINRKTIQIKKVNFNRIKNYFEN